MRPGMSVSLVARQHGVAPNQVFNWRRLYTEGPVSAVGAGEEVVPASQYRALHCQTARNRDPGSASKRDPFCGVGAGLSR